MNPDLHNTPTEALWAELRQLLGDLATNLRRVALIYCELRDRGEDVSVIDGPITFRLPAVAEGRLLPDVLVRYPGKPDLLDAAQMIVPEDQRRLAADGARIPVMTRPSKPRRQPDLTPDMGVLFDILNLTSGQRADFTAAAAAVSLNPIDLNRRLLINHRIIRDT